MNRTGRVNLFALSRVPQSQWPPEHHYPLPREVWRNNNFLVQVYDETGGILRVSVNRVVAGRKGKWLDGITWENLMEIKRQIGRGQEYAVEVLPRDRDIVNVANMRHFWILPAPVCGWTRQ